MANWLDCVGNDMIFLWFYGACLRAIDRLNRIFMALLNVSLIGSLGIYGITYASSG